MMGADGFLTTAPPLGEQVEDAADREQDRTEQPHLGSLLAQQQDARGDS
jgi:hypothetical protein